MTIAAIREKLHEYINVAEDKKVKAIYTMVEDEITHDQSVTIEKILFLKQAATDPLFLADLKEIKSDFDAIDHETI